MAKARFTFCLLCPGCNDSKDNLGAFRKLAPVLGEHKIFILVEDVSDHLPACNGVF